MSSNHNPKILGTKGAKRRSNVEQAYQIKSEVLSLLAEANSTVPVERRVTPKAALEVSWRALNASRGFSFAARRNAVFVEVTNFILASQGDMTLAAESRHSDLFSVSHPMSTTKHVYSMTASALKSARTQWLLADSSVTEDIRPLVASALTAEDGSYELTYALAGLRASGKFDVLESLTAAFGGGGNSYWERSMRAKLQRRDRKGRFAYMGGGLRALIRAADGSVSWLTGRVVGMDTKSTTYDIETPDGKIRRIPSADSEGLKAVIPAGAMDSGFSDPINVMASDKGNIIDISDLAEVSSPAGWSAWGEPTSNSDGSTFQSFKHDSGEYSVGVLTAADGTKSLSIRDEKDADAGSILGKVSSWADVATTLRGNTSDKEKRSVKARLDSEGLTALPEEDLADMLDTAAPAEVSKIDTAGDIEAQVRAAMDSGNDIEFAYPDSTTGELTNRVITPKDVKTERDGLLSVGGVDKDGNFKKFKVDRMVDSTSEEPVAEIPAEGDKPVVEATDVDADGNPVMRPEGDKPEPVVEATDVDENGNPVMRPEDNAPDETVVPEGDKPVAPAKPKKPEVLLSPEEGGFTKKHFAALFIEGLLSKEGFSEAWHRDWDSRKALAEKWKMSEADIAQAAHDAGLDVPAEDVPNKIDNPEDHDAIFKAAEEAAAEAGIETKPEGRPVPEDGSTPSSGTRSPEGDWAWDEPLDGEGKWIPTTQQQDKWQKWAEDNNVAPVAELPAAVDSLADLPPVSSERDASQLSAGQIINPSQIVGADAPDGKFEVVSVEATGDRGPDAGGANQVSVTLRPINEFGDKSARNPASLFMAEGDDTFDILVEGDALGQSVDVYGTKQDLVDQGLIDPNFTPSGTPSTSPAANLGGKVDSLADVKRVSYEQVGNLSSGDIVDLSEIDDSLQGKFEVIATHGSTEYTSGEQEVGIRNGWGNFDITFRPVDKFAEKSAKDAGFMDDSLDTFNIEWNGNDIDGNYPELGTYGTKQDLVDQGLIDPNFTPDVTPSSTPAAEVKSPQEDLRVVSTDIFGDFDTTTGNPEEISKSYDDMAQRFADAMAEGKIPTPQNDKEWADFYSEISSQLDDYIDDVSDEMPRVENMSAESIVQRVEAIVSPNPKVIEPSEGVSDASPAAADVISELDDILENTRGGMGFSLSQIRNFLDSGSLPEDMTPEDVAILADRMAAISDNGNVPSLVGKGDFMRNVAKAVRGRSAGIEGEKKRLVEDIVRDENPSFDAPAGMHSLDLLGYEPDAESSPELLANRYDEFDLTNLLEFSLKNGGFAYLDLGDGEVDVPSEALYRALEEHSADAEAIANDLYGNPVDESPEVSPEADIADVFDKVSKPILKPELDKLSEEGVKSAKADVDADYIKRHDDTEIPALLRGLTKDEYQQFVDGGYDHTDFLPANQFVRMPDGFNNIDMTPFPVDEIVTVKDGDSMNDEGFPVGWTNDPYWIANNFQDDPDSLIDAFKSSFNPDHPEPGYAMLVATDENGDDFAAWVDTRAVRDALQLQGYDTNSILRDVANEGFAGQRGENSDLVDGDIDAMIKGEGIDIDADIKGDAPDEVVPSRSAGAATEADKARYLELQEIIRAGERDGWNIPEELSKEFNELTEKIRQDSRARAAETSVLPRAEIDKMLDYRVARGANRMDSEDLLEELLSSLKGDNLASALFYNDFATTNEAERIGNMLPRDVVSDIVKDAFDGKDIPTKVEDIVTPKKTEEPKKNVNVPAAQSDATKALKDAEKSNKVEITEVDADSPEATEAFNEVIIDTEGGEIDEGTFFTPDIPIQGQKLLSAVTVVPEKEVTLPNGQKVNVAARLVPRLDGHPERYEITVSDPDNPKQSIKTNEVNTLEEAKGLHADTLAGLANGSIVFEKDPNYGKHLDDISQGDRSPEVTTDLLANTPAMRLRKIGGGNKKWQKWSEENFIYADGTNQSRLGDRVVHAYDGWNSRGEGRIVHYTTILNGRDRNRKGYAYVAFADGTYALWATDMMFLNSRDARAVNDPTTLPPSGIARPAPELDRFRVQQAAMTNKYVIERRRGETVIRPYVSVDKANWKAETRRAYDMWLVHKTRVDAYRKKLGLPTDERVRLATPGEKTEFPVWVRAILTREDGGDNAGGIEGIVAQRGNLRERARRIAQMQRAGFPQNPAVVPAAPSPARNRAAVATQIPDDEMSEAVNSINDVIDNEMGRTGYKVTSEGNKLRVGNGISGYALEQVNADTYRISFESAGNAPVVMASYSTFDSAQLNLVSMLNSHADGEFMNTGRNKFFTLQPTVEEVTTDLADLVSRIDGVTVSNTSDEVFNSISVSMAEGLVNFKMLQDPYIGNWNIYVTDAAGNIVSNNGISSESPYSTMSRLVDVIREADRSMAAGVEDVVSSTVPDGFLADRWLDREVKDIVPASEVDFTGLISGVSESNPDRVDDNPSLNSNGEVVSQGDFINAGWTPRKAAEIAHAGKTRPSLTYLNELAGQWVASTDREERRLIMHKMASSIARGMGAGDKVNGGRIDHVRTNISIMSANSWTASFSFDVTDSNNQSMLERGTLGQRTITVDNGVMVEIHNDLLKMATGAAGAGGFATLYNQHTENWYIANGAKKITVQAAGGGNWTGAYVWAITGFNWSGSGSARSKLRDVSDAVDATPAGSRARKDFDAVIAKAAKTLGVDNNLQSVLNKLGEGGDLPKGFPTPRQFALVGWTPKEALKGGDKGKWAGQTGMKSRGWYGTKNLTPDAQERVEQIAYDDMKFFRTLAKSGKTNFTPNSWVKKLFPSDSNEYTGDKEILKPYADEFSDLMSGSGERSVSLLSPKAKAALAKYITDSLNNGTHIQAGNTAAIRTKNEENSAALADILSALHRDQTERYPSRVNMSSRGQQLREVSSESIRGIGTSDTPLIVDGADTGFIGKRLTGDDAGSAPIWKFVDSQTGETFFIKEIDSFQGNEDGVNAEIQANVVARAMNLLGVANVQAMADNPSMMITSEVASTLNNPTLYPSLLPNGQSPTLIRASQDARFQDTKNMDLNNAMGIFALDILIGNTDRHDNNIMMVRNRDVEGATTEGNAWIPVPFDHAFSEFLNPTTRANAGIDPSVEFMMSDEIYTSTRDWGIGMVNNLGPVTFKMMMDKRLDVLMQNLRGDYSGYLPQDVLDGIMSRAQEMRDLSAAEWQARFS